MADAEINQDSFHLNTQSENESIPATDLGKFYVRSDGPQFLDDEGIATPLAILTPLGSQLLSYTLDAAAGVVSLEIPEHNYDHLVLLMELWCSNTGAEGQAYCYFNNNQLALYKCGGQEYTTAIANWYSNTTTGLKLSRVPGTGVYDDYSGWNKLMLFNVKDANKQQQWEIWGASWYGSSGYAYGRTCWGGGLWMGQREEPKVLSIFVDGYELVAPSTFHLFGVGVVI